MTTPTLSPAEQIARFIERHPGKWGEVPAECARPPFVGSALHISPTAILVIWQGPRGVVMVNCHRPAIGFYHRIHWHPPGADLLTQAVFCIADVCQLHNVPTDTLPPWLADPVRQILRTRAGELLTLAGFSPADVVSAAETVDEALCGRPAVEFSTNGILAALQAIGMSCRWVRAEPMIALGDFVYLRSDYIHGAPADIYNALLKTLGRRRLDYARDMGAAPAIVGYRVFVALARTKKTTP